MRDEVGKMLKLIHEKLKEDAEYDPELEAYYVSADLLNYVMGILYATSKMLGGE